MEDRGQSGVEPVIAFSQRLIDAASFRVGRKNACLRNASDCLRKAFKKPESFLKNVSGFQTKDFGV